MPQADKDAAKRNVDFDEVSTCVKVFGLMQIDRAKLQEKGNEYGECEVCTIAIGLLLQYQQYLFR